MPNVAGKVLVLGFGVNDADYQVSVYVRGKKKICPYYRRWFEMLRRCYDSKYQETHPTYIGCSVTEEWKYFSNFKRWMEKQDWEGRQLDKDILIRDNKIYSENSCIFVESKINSFLTDHAAKRGNMKQGVLYVEKLKKYRARISDRKGGMKHLGYFDSEYEAHLVWWEKKIEYAKDLIKEFKLGEIVAECLLNRTYEMKESQ